MNTIQEVIESFNNLNSEDGAIQFILQRTYLPKDRAERIYRLGSPWPFPEGIKELECIEAILEDKPTVYGVRPVIALDALSQLRQLDIDELEAFIAAQACGENPTPPIELTSDPFVEDHMMEVAQLSGENLEVVYEVFRAEIQRLQCIVQMVGQVAKFMEEPQKFLNSYS